MVDREVNKQWGFSIYEILFLMSYLFYGTFSNNIMNHEPHQE